MKIKVLQEAEDDLIADRKFYDERQPGLGDYCIKCLIADIELLPRTAGSHAKHYGSHRSICERFPYAIYYRLEDDVLQIRAVVDCRHRPAWIRKHVKRRLESDDL